MAVAEVLAKNPDLYSQDLKAPTHPSQIVTCMPTEYPRQQIRAALRKEKTDVQNLMTHMKSDREFREYLKKESFALTKARSIDEEHFVWAVRFQCLRHTCLEIAAS